MKNKSQMRLLYGILIGVVVLSLVYLTFFSAQISGDDKSNYASYDSIKKEVTGNKIILKDCNGIWDGLICTLGLKTNVAELKLNTPHSYLVLSGKDTEIAEFEINNLNDFNNVFNKMEFYNKNNMQSISKTFKYKYKTKENYLEDNYQLESCKIKVYCDTKLLNYSKDDKCYSSDSYEIDSFCPVNKPKIMTRDTWTDIEPAKLLKLDAGNITIRIYTDTYIGEKVEWIPTLFNTKINEWADYTVADCNVTAVGGNLTLNGDWCSYEFTQNGSFNVTQNIINAKILIVAGGGGSGGCSSAGGSGAGAGGLIFINVTNLSVANYSIIIGRGGLGGGAGSTDGSKGGNSTFNGSIAIGGGPGRGTAGNGYTGGSGGGAYGTAAGKYGVPQQNGTNGYGHWGGGTNTPGGGGGGSATNGTNGTGSISGYGGNGTAFNLTNGTMNYYAGGGGGGYTIGKAGGLGGGGFGGSYGNNSVDQTAGVNGTGGGAGGTSGAGAIAGKAGGSGVVIITYQILNSDTSYPQFTNNLTSITNGSEYSLGNSYFFNITIENTNGTSGIELNGINYTLSNITNSFYYNAGSLTAGTFSYYFWAYGNGASNLFNVSQMYSYTIIQNSSYNLTITGTTPINYGTQAGISNSSCPSQISCVLNRNNTGAISSPDNSILSAGYYNYTFNSSGNSNYSAKSISFILQVNPDIINPQINFTTPTQNSGANLSQNFITANVSIIESNLANISYSLYNSSFNTNGLVGYWSFDRNTTIIRDLSGNGNDGTNNGAVWNSSGKFGGDYIFNSGRYLEIKPFSSMLQASQSFTICSWAKSNSDSTTAIIGSSDINYGFYVGVLVNSIYTGIMNGTDEQQHSINVGWSNDVWNYVCLTFNGSDLNESIYYNGGNVFNASTNGYSVSNGNLRVGTSWGWNYWDGSIDEVMIFNRTLSPLEISSLYNRSLVNHTTYSTQSLINWTNLVDNNYHYFADALDSSENYNFTEFRNILLDTTNPLIDYGTGTPVNYANLSQSNIYINLSTTETNLANISYYLYNSSFDTNSLIGYWNFDRNTSTVKDLSGNGNDGTNNGAIWNSSGKLGGDYEFDGVNNKIVISNLNDFSTPLTLGFWFNPTSNSEKTIMDKGNSYTNWALVQMNSGTRLRLALLDSVGNYFNCYGTNNLTSNNWTYGTIVLNGTYCYIYLNGVIDTTTNFTSTIGNISGDFRIGTRFDAYDYFNGSIDEVMIFNRSLSASEISTLYNRTLVNHTEYSTQTNSINFTNLNDGYYSYFADILDTANNYNFTSIKTITLDTTSPNANLILPLNNTLNTTQSQNITFNVSDNLGIKNVTIYIYNQSGEYNQTTTNFAINTFQNTVGIVVVLVDNVYNWWVKVFDWAGNSYTTQNNTITIDSIPPSIFIDYPLNQSYNLNVSTLNYIYSDANPGFCWYSNSSGIWNSSAVSVGTNFTNVISIGGSNTWTIYCNDSLNNINSSSITFYTNKLWYNSAPSEINSFRVSQFINRTGANFSLGGVPYHLIGADSYYLADYATNHTYDDDGNEINGSREYVLEILNEAQYLNINVVRTWAGMSGGGSSTNWAISNVGGHYNLFEVGVPGNYSESMYQSLDWLISEASKRDIRLQLVLINNWDEYGGMNWYNHQSPTVNQSYQNITDNSDSRWDTYHDQFYNDTNTLIYFKNYINHTLNRNNTVTGILYKNDPAIFSWMIANEPRAKTDGKSRGLIRNFTINITSYIKSIDSNHLVTLGIEGLGYNETWGEGTDVVSDQNGTGVDYATFALHPAHWDYFALRGETATNGDWICTTTGASCNINTKKFRDFWVNGTNYTYNNRYSSGNVADYLPKQNRHTYDNWVTQNVKWANQMGLPVLLQEMSIDQGSTDVVKDYVYNNTIHNFYSNGGDGLLYWTLNHDNYYYSTQNSSYAGKMDDGYAFYVSDDPALKIKSASVINSFHFAETDNNGGSWITYLNNYKYDFTINLDTPVDTILNNCSLNLNINNGTYRNVSVINSSAIIPNQDYVFSYQFNSSDKNFTWYTQCCGSGACFNSNSSTVSLSSSNPIITLLTPTNNSINNNNMNFVYMVNDSLDISNCQLYINGLLNATDTTVTAYINQSFLAVLSSGINNYSYYVKCTNIVNTVGISEIRNFTTDSVNPNATLLTPTTNYYNNTNQNFTANLSDNYGLQNATLYIYNSSNGQVNTTIFTSISGTLQSVVGVVVALTDGIYKWFYQVFDLAGNSYTTQNNTFTKDNTNPQIDWGTGTLADNLIVSQSNIYMNITWTEINPYSITFYADVSHGCTGTCNSYDNFTGIADGTWAYYAKVCDLAGNCNSTNTRTITLDTTPPMINITYPLNTTYLSVNVNITNYTYHDNNLGYCWWTNNSGLINSTKVIAGINFSISNAPDGSNTWTVYCNDSAGNINSSSVAFIKISDNTAPNLVVNYPINKGSYGTYGIMNLILNVTATDNSSISSMWYSKNNGVTNVSFMNLTGVILPVNAGTSKAFTIYIWVNDTYNNINSTSLNISILNSAPMGLSGIVSYEDSIIPIEGVNLTIENKTIPASNILVTKLDKECSIKTVNNIRNCLTGFIDSSYKNIIVFIIILCSMIILTEYYDVGLTRIIKGKRRKKKEEKEESEGGFSI